MNPLLSIEDLSVFFQQESNVLEAISHVSLDIFPGEIVAIVGESGSGKSLTALSILQLLPANASTKGSIRFYDNKSAQSINLFETKHKALREIRGNKISMIFQEPMTSLNPLMECGIQVMEALRAHRKLSSRKIKKIAKEALFQAGIPVPETIFNRYPHQLSGGQKQRVMIAMAIVCQPVLLIADEPTTALDVKVQHQILLTLQELKHNSEMAVLLITHDLGVVADIADKIIVMHKGKIVENGSKEDILKNPQHTYTKALLACRPAAYPKGIRLPQVSEFNEEFVSPVKPAIINNKTDETEKTTMISVSDLCVFRSNKAGKGTSLLKAVDNVSFEIYKNEIVGLVGQSGCGKTTLGRTMLNLIRPTSGSIRIHGKEIANSSRKEWKEIRKELQIVFQDPFGSLNPRLNIGNAIAEVMQVHNMYKNDRSRKEKVIELLEKVNLNPDHFNRYPHQFSGGQRQRICIARALASEPSFIIFDEAVSALDVSVQAQVLNLINDLKADFGFTALFISHDLGLVRYISDRIMIMKSGKIIETGNAEDIFNAPRESYTRSLLDAIPGKSLRITNII